STGRRAVTTCSSPAVSQAPDEVELPEESVSPVARSIGPLPASFEDELLELAKGTAAEPEDEPSDEVDDVEASESLELSEGPPEPPIWPVSDCTCCRMRSRRSGPASGSRKYAATAPAPM